MSHEQTKPRRTPAEIFGLTANEQLWSAVSEQRLQDLLANKSVTIHKVEISSNAFGEYVFVTLSKSDGGADAMLSFYGLGFHEHREQWITDRWHWYTTNPNRQTMQNKISHAEAQRLLADRRTEIESQQTDTAPSQRALLYALLADLTDEDGALTELEDLENLGFDVDAL